jgi:hypothetical protein
MQVCCNRVNLEVVSGYRGILKHKVATTLCHGMMTRVEYRYAYHRGIMRYTLCSLVILCSYMTVSLDDDVSIAIHSI